jgi:Ser/Thr protein kinase RdoA (MazF antagonist)
MVLHALYSMPRLDGVAKLVGGNYDVGELRYCTLANRGFNDVYLVETVGGEKFVLRIANRRARKLPNHDYETAFLSHLASLGVPVAAPVATREGRCWSRAVLAEGERTAVLFRYLEGRIARRGCGADAYAQGRVLGQIHSAGQDYAGPRSRLQLDAQHLVEAPLAAIHELPTLQSDDRTYVSELAARLLEQLEATRHELIWGRCHGDCHGYNARIVEGVGGSRAAFFFDFDDGGPGWLAYNIAVYLWNRALDPETLHQWPAFLRGYQSTHPLPRADLDATLLFVPIRHVWLLGEYASRAEEWGLDNLSASWFSRQVAFLRRWEEAHLVARLF